MYYPTKASAVEKYDENGKPEEYTLACCIHGHAYYKEDETLNKPCVACLLEAAKEMGILHECPTCGAHTYVTGYEDYCYNCDSDPFADQIRAAIKLGLPIQ
jgi:hypothetical protein